MLEKKITIKGLNPAELFGVRNKKLKYIKSFFPKLKVITRGNILTISGDEEVMSEFEKKFDLILRHFHKYNSLTSPLPYIQIVSDNKIEYILIIN